MKHLYSPENQIQAHPPILQMTIQGEGRPVILVHGMASSRHGWGQMQPALTGAGYKSYAVDLLGHGDSYKPRHPNLYQAQAVYHSFYHWLEHLRLEQKTILIGHSLGGYLSMRYALHYPERVEALVLIDPLYTPQQLHALVRAFRARAGLGASALRYVPEWLLFSLMVRAPIRDAGLSVEAYRQVAADIKRASPFILHLPRSFQDLTPRLSQLQLPTLVLWGEKDPTLAPASFPRLVEALPRGCGQPVAGCGHSPHLGNPEQVNRLVLAFLESL